MGKEATNEVTDPLADNVLAFAWIYGDVVHADVDRLAETEHLGVKERHRAAAPVICQVMVTTIGTLNFIKSLITQGAIRLPAPAFIDEVVVESTEFRQELVQLYVAPSIDDPQASDVPRLGEPLGPGWRKLFPDEP